MFNATKTVNVLTIAKPGKPGTVQMVCEPNTFGLGKILGFVLTLPSGDMAIPNVHINNYGNIHRYSYDGAFWPGEYGIMTTDILTSDVRWAK